jgi:hypothetical protein
VTNVVKEQRARAKAAVAHWQEVRRSVDDLDSVPARLDQIVSIADRALTRIDQDVVIEINAIVAELSTLRFPVDGDDRLNELEGATLMLDRALSRVSRTASRAGFAEVEYLEVPPGLRIPVAEIANQLEILAKAIEAGQSAIKQIDATQSEDGRASSRQTALVRDLVEKASLKIDIISIKTREIRLLDVSGVVGLARQLTRLLESFVAIVLDTSSHLSQWLDRAARDEIRPKIALISEGTSLVVGRAAAWVKTRGNDTEGSSADKPQPVAVLLQGVPDGNFSEMVNELNNITKGVVQRYSETWIFDDFDKIVRMLHVTQVRRAILTIHDLDIGPMQPREVLAAIQTKVTAVEKKVDEISQSLGQKPDLFWVVLLIAHADDLPFAKFPKGRFSFVHFLHFRTFSDPYRFEADPAAVKTIQMHLKDWSTTQSGSPA